MFTTKEVKASRSEFVTFWRRFYASPLEDLYSENIAKPLTPDRIRSLFIWKNGSRLSERKGESVEKNYIQRLDELLKLPSHTPAGEFLEMFSGGAIWKIFLLHCWRPNCFPIYDQHAHRAMSHITNTEPQELGKMADKGKIQIYIEQYIPFFKGFDNLNYVDVDRALWVFGRYVKEWA